jgi:nucleoside-diphosphate-sugar epimerase
VSPLCRPAFLTLCSNQWRLPSDTCSSGNVKDIARADILAAKANVSDRVFNVASGTETSLRELAEALMRAMGVEASIEFGPERKMDSI